MASSARLRRFVATFSVAAVAVTGVVASGALSAPATADPTPTISSVQARLADLAHKNETLTESFNKARIDANAKKAAAATAQRAADAAAKRYASARTSLNAAIVAQYKSVGTGQTSALLTSRSGQNYVDQVTTLSILGSHRSDVVGQAKAFKTVAQNADRKAHDLLADARKRLAAVSSQRTSLQKDIDKYNALLNTLTAAQRQAVTNQVGGKAVPGPKITTGPVPAPSKRAQTAVNFALAQQGKPYVFAASGPDAYDCSGLTAAAWAAAGVQIPHFAASQYDYGTHVSQSQLAPGDLVFFYQPIGHVAMYIGNGLIVHAPTEGDVVKVVPLSTFASDYVGATRLT